MAIKLSLPVRTYLYLFPFNCGLKSAYSPSGDHA